MNSDMRASRVDSGVSLVKVGDESLFKVWEKTAWTHLRFLSLDKSSSSSSLSF